MKKKRNIHHHHQYKKKKKKNRKRRKEKDKNMAADANEARIPQTGSGRNSCLVGISLSGSPSPAAAGLLYGYLAVTDGLLRLRKSRPREPEGFGNQ